MLAGRILFINVLLMITNVGKGQDGLALGFAFRNMHAQPLNALKADSNFIGLSGASDSAFLASCRGLPMLLIHRPYFE